MPLRKTLLDRELTAAAARLSDDRLQSAIRTTLRQRVQAVPEADVVPVAELDRRLTVLRGEQRARATQERRRQEHIAAKKAQRRKDMDESRRRKAEFGAVAIKVKKRPPKSVHRKADPSGGVSQVVRGGLPSLGRRR